MKRAPKKTNGWRNELLVVVWIFFLRRDEESHLLCKITHVACRSRAISHACHVEPKLQRHLRRPSADVKLSGRSFLTAGSFRRDLVGKTHLQGVRIELHRHAFAVPFDVAE